MPAERIQGHRFEILIPGSLLPALARWFQASGGRRSGTTLAIFLSEIVQQKLADFLSLSIPPKLDESVVFKEIKEIRKPIGRSKLSRPEDKQRVIFKHLSGMSISDIACTEGVGASTIGRIVRAYEKNQLHTRIDQGACRIRKRSAESHFAIARTA